MKSSRPLKSRKAASTPSTQGHAEAGVLEVEMTCSFSTWKRWPTSLREGSGFPVERFAKRKNVRVLRTFSHRYPVTDPRVSFVALTQLVQDLINGSVRRHTFTELELQLLLDLQNSKVRKSSRPELLRRYLRAAQQQLTHESSLLRLSAFIERESQARAVAEPPRSSHSLDPQPVG
jgi:hypothetical protein